MLVACSGGADSLALAAATVFVAPRLGRARRSSPSTTACRTAPPSAPRRWPPGAARSGSRRRPWCRVEVAGRPGGPEAAAREARYEALAEAARQQNAVAVLTGHTRDDQAETVLLALARGAGPRGLAGMPARRELDGVPLLRPLLEISRDQTRGRLRRARAEPVAGPAQQPTRRTPGPGCGPTCCRRWCARSGPAWWTTSRVPPGWWRPTTPRSTSWRRRRWRRPGTLPAGCPCRSCSAWFPPCAAGCCTPGPASWAPCPGRCRTGTSPPWTRWSPTGTVRARPICPAVSGCSAAPTDCHPSSRD